MDIQYLLWLQGIREALPPVVESLFVAISAIANSKVLVLVPCLLYWCLDKRAGRYMILTFSFGTLLNGLVKSTVCAYRPWVRSAELHPSEAALADATGYSFPSGHTQSAVNLFGALGWFYRKRLPRLLAPCCVFCVLVAFSRNFLGVHTLQDVLVALLEGAFVLWSVEHMLEWVDAGEGRHTTVLVACMACVVGFLAFVALRPYPMDYDAAGNLLADPAAMLPDCYKSAGVFAGAVLGWFLERRFVDFDANPRELGTRTVVVRLVVGMAVAAVMYLAPRVLLLVGVDTCPYEFIKYFLIALGGMYVAPLAFCAVERRMRPRITKPM